MHRASVGLGARSAAAAAAIVLVVPQALRGSVVWLLPRSDANAGSRSDSVVTPPGLARPPYRVAPHERVWRDTSLADRLSVVRALRTCSRGSRIVCRCSGVGCLPCLVHTRHI